MLDEHAGYVSDPIRLDRFRAAIARALKPGDHVVDLGCGSGILGLLCLEAGASHVTAIDSTAMIEVARETFTRAGFDDRTSFVHGHSQRVELPAPVDLVICDQVGYFGFDYGIVHTLQDARRRFLRPGGTLITSRIRLQVAAVESDSARSKVDAWQADDVPSQFHWLRGHSVNDKHAVELTRAELLSAAATLGDIDLHADNPEFFSWTAALSIERDGTMHGLAGWFDCELADNVWMTNSPLSDVAIKRPQAFLPIDEAIAVKAGEAIEVKVMARPGDNLLAWVVEFPGRRLRFSHSTWKGMLFAPEDLLRTRQDRVPHLSSDGSARMTVLSHVNGTRTVREIEQAVLASHPHLFPSADEITRFVAQVLGRDTE